MSVFASKLQPALKKKRENEEAKRDMDALRKKAREAGKKMPKPEKPKDGPQPEAKPHDPLDFSTMEHEGDD